MWWLLDRSLVQHIIAVSDEMAPYSRTDLVGVHCTFDDEPLTPETIDPVGVRFALAALRHASVERPALRPLAMLVEYAALESATIYSMLDGIETQNATTTAATIAADLALVAPMKGLDRSAVERRLGQWLKAHPEATASPDVPDKGQWFAQRIRDAIPVNKALVFIRSADTRSELQSDLDQIAAALARFIESTTWASRPQVPLA